MRVLKESYRKSLLLGGALRQSLSLAVGDMARQTNSGGLVGIRALTPAAITAAPHPALSWPSLAVPVDSWHILNSPAELTDLKKRIVFLLMRHWTGQSGGQGTGQRRNPKRNYHDKDRNAPPLPRLLYIQNPLIWITNKLDFRYLRVNWDPLFSEAEFSRGARQAVSTVTQLVSKNRFDSMKPLFTKTGLLNLRRDVEIIWADEVRRNIGLAPDDVQLIIPRKLHFRQSIGKEQQKLLERGYGETVAAIIASSQKSEKKYCDIDVLFIALKYLDSQTFHQTPLCFVDIIARFHRNYSDNVPPEWTISAFKVRRFNVIPQKG